MNIKKIKYNIKQYTYIFFQKKYLKRIKKYGIKYIIDIHYRSKCNKKEIIRRQAKRRGNISAKKRYKIKEYCTSRQNNRCFWCQHKFKKGQIKTIDHIVPVSLGGTNTKDNYQIIHDECRLERDKLFKIFNILVGF